MNSVRSSKTLSNDSDNLFWIMRLELPVDDASGNLNLNIVEALPNQVPDLVACIVLFYKYTVLEDTDKDMHLIRLRVLRSIQTKDL